MSDEREELEIQSGDKKASIKTYRLETLAIGLILIVLTAAGVLIFQHVQASEKQASDFITAVENLTKAQRELTCIITYPEAVRETKAEFCKRIARW